MGRLSLTSENDIDEMFELFFEVLSPLAKDATLNNIFYRSYCQLARRSPRMHEQCVDFAESLLLLDEKNAQNTGKELIQEITSEDFNAFIKN
jgi:hypothetical protein